MKRFGACRLQTSRGAEMANDIVALRKDGPVATVTLQRSPANAISIELIELIGGIFRKRGGRSFHPRRHPDRRGRRDDEKGCARTRRANLGSARLAKKRHLAGFTAGR